MKRHKLQKSDRKQNRHHRHPIVPLIALSTPRSASSVDLGAMYVTVQKSIRHKSSRMYHGVYSGRRRSENNDSTSEGERAEERGGERGSKQSLYLCSTLLLLRPFVRSFDHLFYTRRFLYRVLAREGGPVEVAQLAGTASMGRPPPSR